MPLAFPAVEKRAEGDAPVTVEPCPDELLRAGSPQPLLVRLNVYVLVVVDLRRDEHPLEPSHRIADDAVAQGRRIDVTGLDPLMSWPARVSRRTQTDWHACAGAQRRHQFHHWGGAREIPDLLYINSRVVVALVHVGIGIALQIGEAQPGAVRRTPHLLRLVERPSQRPVDFSRALDGFHKLRSGPPDHEPDGILAIAARMSAELAEHAVSFAPASSATEEDFKYLTLQQPHLGRIATRRPSNPNLGLGDHGITFSSAPSVRPDMPRTPSLSTKPKLRGDRSLHFPRRRPRLRSRGLCRSPYRLPRSPNPLWCPPRQLADTATVPSTSVGRELLTLLGCSAAQQPSRCQRGCAITDFSSIGSDLKRKFRTRLNASPDARCQLAESARSDAAFKAL